VFKTSTFREQRHWPSGTCPSDLQTVRLFFAPLQRNLNAGCIGEPTQARATIATHVDQDSGVIIDDASGDERFEGNGYLTELARTQLLFPSDDFEDAAWTNSNVTVLASQTGVGGEASVASKLTAGAANATLINDLGVIGSAATNGVLWIERVTGTGDIDLTLDGGSTWTTVAVTSTFTVFPIQQTLANPDFGIRIVTSGDEVLVQAAYVAAAGFATSVLPSTSGTVVRNSDTLTWPTANNFNEAKGVIYCEVDFHDGNGGQEYVLQVDDTNNTNAHLIWKNSGATSRPGYFVAIGGTQANIQAAGGADDMGDSTPKRIAAIYAADDFELVTSGQSRGTDTSGNLPSSLTAIRIGGGVALSLMSGHVRNVQTFSERLTAFEAARIA